MSQSIGSPEVAPPEFDPDRIGRVVNSPQAHHISTIRCICGDPRCGCDVKRTKARAVLALMEPEEAEVVAARFGIDTFGDERFTVEEALAVLGLSFRAARGVVVRVRQLLETRVLFGELDDADLDGDTSPGVGMSDPELVAI